MRSNSNVGGNVVEANGTWIGGPRPRLIESSSDIENIVVGADERHADLRRARSRTVQIGGAFRVGALVNGDGGGRGRRRGRALRRERRRRHRPGSR